MVIKGCLQVLGIDRILIEAGVGFLVSTQCSIRGVLARRVFGIQQTVGSRETSECHIGQDFESKRVANVSLNQCYGMCFFLFHPALVGILMNYLPWIQPKDCDLEPVPPIFDLVIEDLAA